MELRATAVGHSAREKEKLVLRVRRIRGQIEGLERAILGEKPSYEVLQAVAAAKGALNGLMAEVIEDHVRNDVMDPEETVPEKRGRAAEELIDIVRTYVR
jgi:DNA-binding FrmR family transcriptional regulator